MTGRERQILRQLIDQRRRQLSPIGYGPRHHGMHRQGGPRSDLCTGCQMPLDEHTPGCHTCWDRHRRRRERGSSPLSHVCTGCGCPYDEHTRGCITCYFRHRERRRIRGKR